ncbi:MAG: hypothetical protein HKN26_11985 [Acidimicrobiales bacterium]|nr:hypothetical protein [Acidimicrobiales bacterium]
MRFLRATTANTRYEFHPNLTVLSGLDAYAKQRLVADLEAVVNGEDPQAEVMIEAYGIVLDGGEQSRNNLGLQGGFSAVMRATDVASAQREDNGIGEEQLAAARQAYETARERLSALKAATEQLETANREARNRRDDALARQRDLQGQMDPEAANKLKTVLETFRAAESRLQLDPGQGLVSSIDSPTERLRWLQETESVFHERLDTSGRLDRDAILAAAREVHTTRSAGRHATEAEKQAADLACRHLAHALVEVGVSVESIDPTPLLTQAKTWIDQFGTRPEPAPELMAALRQCQAERSRMAATVALHQADTAVYDERLAPVYEELHALEANFDRTLKVVLELLDTTAGLHAVEAELDASGPHYGEMLNQIRQAELERMETKRTFEALNDTVIARPEQVTQRLSNQPAAQEASLSERLKSWAANLRSQDLAGSIPMVIDQALDQLHDAEIGQIVDTLVALSTSLQVIVVSDHEELAGYAQTMTIDKALYVDHSLLPA